MQPLPHARVSVRLHFVASADSTDWKFVLDFAVSRAASHLSCTISLHLTPVLPLNAFPTRRSTSLSRKDWLRCVGFVGLGVLVSGCCDASVSLEHK